MYPALLVAIGDAQVSSSVIGSFFSLMVGLACLFGAVAIISWAGKARAAYIRQYDRLHDATLPAGYIAETVEDFDAIVNKGEIDPFGMHRAERRQRIWAALREPQDDQETERLRLCALRRSISAAVLGLTATALLTLFFVFILPTLFR